MRIILLLLLTFINQQLIAQHNPTFYIKGKVISSVDGKPIDEIIVQRKYSNISITETNEKGEFILRNIAPATFKLEVIGGFDNKDTTIVLDKNIDSLIIKLNDNQCLGLNAQSDIQNKKPKLLLQGGEAPIVYLDQRKQQLKYSFEYLEFGCLVPPKSCSKSYSKIIFKYLDEKYGKKWRKEVRKDVLFLNEF